MTTDPEQNSCEASFEEVEQKRRTDRQRFTELLTQLAGFLKFVKYVESSAPDLPEDPDLPEGEDTGAKRSSRYPWQVMYTDFRNSAVYHYRLQSIWEDAFAALKRAGELVDFCGPAPLRADVERSVSWTKKSSWISSSPIAWKRC